MKGAVRAAIAGMVMATCASAQVEVRGGERVNAAIEDATVAGLRVGAAEAGGKSRVVSWDRVKRAAGEPGGESGEKASRFASIADRLWRARTRVERGDFAGAEPLLDELAAVYEAERGPSAAVVAECLMRCRAARGAQGSATSSWLWWTWIQEQRRADGSGEWIGGGIDLPAVIDAATGLAPQLPPVWAAVASTNAAATSPEWSKVRARGGKAAELAEMYEKAARFEAGMDGEVVVSGAGAGSDGVALVREMVIARGGDAGAREVARQALRGRLMQAAPRPEGSKVKTPPMPRWTEAWCRLALGRSLIRETDNSMRMRGVIELLHLPARFGSEQPFLAGIALADAAVTMWELGDAAGASALKGELLSKFGSHPVVGWDALRKISTSGTSGARVGIGVRE